jgi:adenine-specific DNA-methyltransferase
MKLKHAILESLSRDELKKICGDLEIEEVDLRSAEAMSDKLSRARQATAEILLGFLSESQVKGVADTMGVTSHGRRAALIQSLIERERGDGQKHNVVPRLKGAETDVNGGAGRKTGSSAAKTATEDQAEAYRHADKAVQRPAIGVQDQFQARKPSKTYEYDSSLDPALSWDEQRERGLGEWLLGLIERAATEGEKAVFAEGLMWKGGGVKVTSTMDVVRVLKDISKPFLNWAGKAERHQIDIPSVPLFVHEHHSTKAILAGIRHRRAKGLSLDLFGDPNMDVTDQLAAYEHKGPWQNRMILGDSLQVMNSMLEYEGLGGQVQMVYMDPPYGVKFGSNFQPFVRSNSVKDGVDSDFTREPEMVKAYRDTWELGLHSYLTYLRDRLTVGRELLHSSGSMFVQISDENLHYVRSLLSEVFGASCFVAIIVFQKTASATSELLAGTADYILWYARDITRCKYKRLYTDKLVSGAIDRYDQIELPGGARRPMTAEEKANADLLPAGSKRVQLSALTSTRPPGDFPVQFNGKAYRPRTGYWKTGKEGFQRLIASNRVVATSGGTLRYVRYASDFGFQKVDSLWTDISGAVQSRSDPKVYVVQTSTSVMQRCIQMTTDSGDLVFDPTCGSGTTAFVAERWGRRWITCDTSRVPLALARQRLLTATFPYYELKDLKLGPAGGFVYKRKQNRKGEDVGGLVPHITLKSIANDQSAPIEMLVDRPEELAGVTRVSGPFVVEATVAPVQPFEGRSNGETVSGDAATHIERMTEVLRQSKTLRLPGNRELVLSGIRRTVDSEYMHAEAKEGGKRIAIVFGPQDGAISSSLVFEAVREAYFLKYDQIYFFGFAIEANARGMIEDEKKLRIPAVYVAVTPDVAMSDLLKTTRASEIFSITGLPDFEIKEIKRKGAEGQSLYEVELEGLDIFDPETLETESVDGEKVPCWMLDTDYDGMCFYATQVFFPKTGAWKNLQKSLKATFDESVWEHLAGTTSEPFAMGKENCVAVKVIDERGNELLSVKKVAA